MPLTLPTVPTPATHLSPKALIIYGPPKVGKTSISAVLPESLLVDIEDGSDYVTATKLKLSNIFEFTALEDAIKKANKPYKYGILDSLDKLEEWCEEEATRRYKASVIGQSFKGATVLLLPNGGGYMHLRNVFYEYFQRFRQLFPYTIFIGHVRDRMLGTEGKEVSAKDLDLTGKVRNIACAYADAIAYAYRAKDAKLTLSFVTNDLVNCGSRCDHLRGKEFTFSTPATANDWNQIYVRNP